jgi:hypothetical protein
MGLISFFSSIFRSALNKLHEKQIQQLYKKSQTIKKQDIKVLFWIPGGMPLMLHIECAIAIALKLRGVDVHAIICDGALSRGCIKRESSSVSDKIHSSNDCIRCKNGCDEVLKIFNIPISYIGDFVSDTVKKDCLEKTKNISWDKLNDVYYNDISLIGSIKGSILRYYQGNYQETDNTILRDYTMSAFLSAFAADKAIQKINPDKIFMSTGIYVDWGPALKIAKKSNIPVTGYMSSYLPARFYFRHVKDASRINFQILDQEKWDYRKNISLKPIEEYRLKKYIDERYFKNRSFDLKKGSTYQKDLDGFLNKYKISKDMPIWGIMSHLNWDSAIEYSPMAYETFDDWIVDTVNKISPITNIQWLIKIHPSEIWSNSSTYGTNQLIKRHFPKLPENIKIIPPEENISPLNFYEILNGGITVFGTPGLELALMGKPVILAGEAHYSKKGFTYDGLTVDLYREYLNKTSNVTPLNSEQIQLAQRYAYCYFIQRQIPMPVVKNPHSTWWEFQFSKRDLLLPGKDPFMDFICEKIMSGEDFIMDEKLVQLAEKF